MPHKGNINKTKTYKRNLLPTDNHLHTRSTPILVLLQMSVLHFIFMYVLMYAMIDNISHALVNVNQFYMAGIMTAPMVILELFFMRNMYGNRMSVGILFLVAAIVFSTLFTFIRYQTGIGNTELIRSMIPHHSGAIRMCSHAKVSDPEVIVLCNSIVRSQLNEIDQMSAILQRLSD